MTAQIGDKIHYKGMRYSLSSEPLSAFLLKNKINKFNELNTACWRGYVAEWEVVDNKLYLVDIRFSYSPRKKITVKTKDSLTEIEKLFPGQTKVHANWVSSTLIIKTGKLIEYIHMGYESIYEIDIYLKFETGKLIDERIVNNTSKE